MIEALSPFFTGPLEAAGEVLSTGLSASDMLLTCFLSNGGLQEALEAYSRQWETPHPQATATQWSKLYFSRLLPAALIPALTGQWKLPLDPRTMGLKLNSDGAVTGFVLKDAGGILPEPDNRFAFLVDDHLVPVISALADKSEVPAKVIWNNAGNIFEAILTEAAAILGQEHPGIRDGYAVISGRRLSDGRPNPLFEPVRYRETAAGTKRVRRLCCLRYLNPALGVCKSCPKSGVPIP